MSRTSRIFDGLLVAFLISGIWAAYLHRVSIGDWVYFRSYQPDTAVVKLADDAGLSADGRHLLYRGDPQFVSSTEMAQYCEPENLGCLTTKGDIYVQDDAQKYDGVVVTSAHEMLHLAYRRLSQQEKDDLAPLVEQAIEQISDSFLQKELSGLDGDARLDEAHSVLGTEYASLPPALEMYYQKYFGSRVKVLAAEQRAEQAPD